MKARPFATRRKLTFVGYLSRSCLTIAGSMLLPILLSGCYVTKSATVPMALVHHAGNGEAGSLIVFLPGLGDGPEAFEEKGMLNVVREIAPAFDVIAADAHFAYYQKQNVVERIHVDIIEPLADRYQHVWFVGVSMGGLGAASYALEHPGVIEGMILLAPYMGERDLITELEQAGGLRQWVAPNPTNIEDATERHFTEIWKWYQRYTDQLHPIPTILLGFGSEDRLRRGIQLLADVLPDEQVQMAPGGHKWRVWTPLFRTLLGGLCDRKDSYCESTTAAHFSALYRCVAPTMRLKRVKNCPHYDTFS